MQGKIIIVLLLLLLTVGILLLISTVASLQPPAPAPAALLPTTAPPRASAEGVAAGPEAAPAPAPPSPTQPMVLSATGTAPVLHPEALAEASRALASAADFMAHASIANKGGYVEKSRTDLNEAVVYLSAAGNYLATHPLPDALPTPFAQPAREDDFPIKQNLRAIRDAIAKSAAAPGNVAPNLRRAMEQLQTVVTELQSAPPGEWDGHRLRVAAAIAKAAQDILAGIETVQGHAPTPPVLPVLP